VKVLVYISWPVKAWSIPDEHVARLRDEFRDLELIQPASLDEAAKIIGEIDVSFTPQLTKEMVAAADKLRWVHSSASAVEGLLPLQELAARQIRVTNSRGVQAIPMAEHVMGGLLVLARKYDRLLEAQRARRWIQNDLVNDWPYLLHGKRMTIIGLGSMSQFDYFGRPLRDIWAESPDLRAYSALTPAQSLDEMNPSGTRGARESARLDLDIEDAADEALFNHILWRTLKGPNVPYPGTHRVSARELKLGGAR